MVKMVTQTEARSFQTYILETYKPPRKMLKPLNAPKVTEICDPSSIAVSNLAKSLNSATPVVR